MRERFPGLSGPQIDEAIESGLVTSKNSSPLTKGTRIEGAHELDFSLLEARLELLSRGMHGLSVPVVHEEPDFWVVDKPAGMPGHPLRLSETDTLTHWALDRDPTLKREFPNAQPTLTPHRLDTGTSGVLIVARTAEAYQTWRYRFEAKGVRKQYLAWCWGAPSLTHWVMDAPLGKAKGSRGKMAENGTESRPALTRANVVRTLDDRFLVSLQCETGVTHQVRVHLASRGFPLLGDSIYDDRFQSRSTQPAHHLLRATRLEWEGRLYQVATDSFERAFQ